MKIRLSLLLVFLSFSLSLSAQQQQGQKRPAADNAKVTKGLIGISKTESDWFFHIPDSLLGRRFLVTVRYTTTPAGAEKYGGELTNQQTMYFELTPNKDLVLRSDLLVNTADETDNINRAVKISTENPIVASFKVENSKGGVRKIKVTSLFLSDNAALSLTRNDKTKFGLATMMPQLSYIEDVKTFPLNTEVRTICTWMSAGSLPTARMTGKVTMGLNISFVLLPKEPMRRRLFDPRVGYFTDNFDEYSDFQQRVKSKRFITRWRLEPKDSADAAKLKRGELIEPKKPIVYYIDPATPKQWRKYLIQGVNDWQVAFEQAGFKNAIMGKEWPDSDKTMSMEDARFSVIRYLASDIPNAYGPQVHDPRSGEILESHICWYHNVMQLVHDWYMVQAGTLDEAARSMRFDEELMGQLIRFVSSHEVGHTLGLRHNFGSSSTVPVDSLRSKSFVETNGHTPSIMDYARFNYVAQPEDSISRVGIFPRIGDYDKWAIEWGYKYLPDAYDDVSDHYELEKATYGRINSNRRLWFGDGESRRIDPRCQTEDLGDDAMKASYYGILNLKREVKQLPEWSYQSGDIYNSNLMSVFRIIMQQFQRYLGHVERNIGGVQVDFKTVDEAGAVYSYTPAEKQKRALKFLGDNVLENEPLWLFGNEYLNRYTPDAHAMSRNVATGLITRLAAALFLANLNKEYPVSEYLPDLTKMVFRNLYKSKALNEYQEALQNKFVEVLIADFKDNTTDARVRGEVLKTLKDLRRRMQPLEGTSAHYANLVDLIDRALVIKG